MEFGQRAGRGDVDMACEVSVYRSRSTLIDRIRLNRMMTYRRVGVVHVGASWPSEPGSPSRSYGSVKGDVDLVLPLAC